jgi:hypothetical protein
VRQADDPRHSQPCEMGVAVDYEWVPGDATSVMGDHVGNTGPQMLGWRP